MPHVLSTAPVVAGEANTSNADLLDPASTERLHAAVGRPDAGDWHRGEARCISTPGPPMAFEIFARYFSAVSRRENGLRPVSAGIYFLEPEELSPGQKTMRLTRLTARSKS